MKKRGRDMDTVSFVGDVFVCLEQNVVQVPEYLALVPGLLLPICTTCMTSLFMNRYNQTFVSHFINSRWLAGSLPEPLHEFQRLVKRASIIILPSFNEDGWVLLGLNGLVWAIAFYCIKRC